MDRRTLMSPESAQASDIFDKFCSANTLKAILSHYRQLCNLLRLQATHFPDFYPRLRSKLCSWRAQGLWSKFEKRASNKCYSRGKSCSGCRVLIIGAGPCGLRTAIEAQLLGAKVVLIEKRDRFSRNNVLHLWPFVITDLKALGAKKFYGKFCAGSIDHISIRQLQCILLKVALLLGVEIHEGVGFQGLCDPTENEGWRAITSPLDHPVSQYHFDCLIGADGRRNTLEGFKRKALRAKLAIAITANFINKRTEAEARVKEISGVSYIFNQKFFQDLNEATGIDLENIVYYKDETHYFVMTAKKHSLLQKGVLLHDYADTAKLLSHENISTEALMIYAIEAAIFSTENQLPNLEYAVNHYGQPDVAMFDFTAMYAAENACRVVQRKGHKLMMTLVGDSLLEPFWPTGSGCARGFLSCFDACWMLRSLATGTKSLMEVIAERESIYRLLGQTTPENLNKEHIGYTIDPHSRYPNLNQRVVMPFQVQILYDSDEKMEEQVDGSAEDNLDLERITKKRRRNTVIAVDSLLSWLRSQVKCYDLEVSDVSDAYVSGDILLAILHRFRPDLIEFPPTSEENISPAEMAACRNQMAFDFLQKEYGVPPVMNGIESVQCNPSDFLTMVAYLSQLHDIFKGEIPQIKYLKEDGIDDLDEGVVGPHYSHYQVKHVRPPSVVAKHGAVAKTSRRSRISSSARDSRCDGETSETSRRHRKRRSDERSRISLEDREKRLQDIERNRTERQRRRVQERILQTERFIKSMRLLQMNDRSDADRENESFEDYTMHLYRLVSPDFEERCKSLEKKLFYSGREHRTSTGESQTDNEKQNVHGLAKHLEEKLKGSKHVEKKPKDLIRAIGKIEKSDWNVQLIEKKIAESKGQSQGKKDRDDKVPKWSREAFDDKREAMKRKMDGGSDKDSTNERAQLFEETMKKLGNKLTDGSALDVGQRGCNKVSQMAEKLVHNLVKSNKEFEPSVVKPMVSRPIFEFPKKGGSEICHFCMERVYVVERMSAEGKFFHRNCFRCEYCNTSLRLGNYSFDREGRYGDRFYCLPHYNTVRLYGWKKYDREDIVLVQDGKLPESGNLLLPPSQQILSEMDERGTTPERVEFENTVDFASEEELLSEMDEDEWTDRNFGASNADNNTSDEASDLSEDDDATPEGVKAPIVSNELLCEQVTEVKEFKDTGSSDSDTEIASIEGSYEDVSCNEEENGDDDDEDEECEEEEEECGGSTTEVETDSEFAEDPPHSVPGKIPTIVVNEPEQYIARMSESTLKSQPKPIFGRARGADLVISRTKQPVIEHYEELKCVEPVVVRQPTSNVGRPLPRVYPILKKWEPMGERDCNQEVVGSKISNELKKRYLHGAGQVPGVGAKRTTDPAAQSHLTSVLDMISEKQKLLQPALQPSPAMMAFLDGTNKFKTNGGTNGVRPSKPDVTPSPSGFQLWPQAQKAQDTSDHNQQCKETITMNRLNLEKTMEAKVSTENEDNTDIRKDILTEISELSVPDDYNEGVANMNGGSSKLDYRTTVHKAVEVTPNLSEAPLSLSQSKTSSQCTVINAATGDLIEDPELLHSYHGDGENNYSDNDDTGSETSTGSETGSAEPLSDLDDMEEENQQISHDPPRVEIEDEFGVALALDVEEKLSSELHSEIKKIEPNDDEEPSLWSDSKDSFSGMFLESDLSDWCPGVGNKHPKKKRNSCTRFTAKRQAKDEKLLPFDLDADLEFVDVSPDDLILSERRKLGYSKLLAEDETIPFVELEGAVEEDIYGNLSDSDRSRSSTSTLGSISNTNQIVCLKSEVVEAVNSSVQIPAQCSTEEILRATLPDAREHFAILDRVVRPFSNARDSLDFRKTKSKDLFSTYTVPSTLVSAKPEAVLSPLISSSSDLAKMEERSGTVKEKRTMAEKGILSNQDLTNNSPSQSQDQKCTASPHTVRRIDEINKERIMQSDLIRAMVMGRIRRSPEKNRRGSFGSLSPIAGTSSSSTSDSGELPKMNVKQVKDGKDNDDSNRSSQNSILSHNTTGTDDSLHSFNNVAVVVGDNDYMMSSEDASQSSSHSKCDDNSRSSAKSHYEPVFTSSPRFRNRPKFDSPLSIYQSVTNPPTPVNPGVSIFTPVTPVTPNSESFKSENVKIQTRTLRKSSSPSLYRSMPDLSKIDDSLEKHNKLGKVSSFATPDVKRWEAYKYTSTIDREKARLEARERARLKSDEELGLSPAERYMELKNKLRRKLSCPEGDFLTLNIIKTNAGYSQSEPNSTCTPSSKSQVEVQCKSEPSQSPSRPVSDVFDNVASSIRHNVDFPMRANVSLASPIQDSPCGRQVVSMEISMIKKVSPEDNLDIHFRITPKESPNRKKSPEKARSVGWDVGAEPFPNYFSSNLSPQQLPKSIHAGRTDHNWFSEINDCDHSTPITVSELNLNQLPGQGLPGNDNDIRFNCIKNAQNGRLGPNDGDLALSHASTGTVTAFSSPDTNTNTKNVNKTKSQSTEMLLDGSPLALAPFRGLSVPDITASTVDAVVAASERKSKKSKDRFRRRSLIQTVSDFFTSRVPNVLSGSNSASITEHEKSSSTNSTTSSSSAQLGGSKDKFSIFKLTPKLLQKDKRSPTAKSRESIPFVPTQGQSSDNSNTKPATIKSPRSSFISYLSQPEMIIQKLSSSPIPFKSTRASLSIKRVEKLKIGAEALPPSCTSQTKEIAKFKPNPNRPEARRMREAREIQLQLESIEIEQRRLESRGVTIEKCLRGEESDDENRDEVELMEEWFTLVREKTRLARFERELIVREKELELEHKQEKVEEKLEESLLIDDMEKLPEAKTKEIEMWHELQSLERQRESLLSKFHEDMQKYESEDADLEAKIASSSLSPRESNV